MNSKTQNEFRKKKTINNLTIVKNNCLRRIFDVYNSIFIAK